MGVMSEMLNFGMGRPGDDDMNFHDLDGEKFAAEAPDAFQVKCDEQCAAVDNSCCSMHGACSEQR